PRRALQEVMCGDRDDPLRSRRERRSESCDRRRRGRLGEHEPITLRSDEEFHGTLGRTPQAMKGEVVQQFVGEQDAGCRRVLDRVDIVNYLYYRLRRELRDLV